MLVKRNLNTEELKINKKILQTITYEDFFKSNNLIDLYDEKGLIISIDNDYNWTIGVMDSHIEKKFKKWDQKAKTVKSNILYATRKKLGVQNEDILFRKKDQENYKKLFNKMYNSYIFNVIQC